MMEHVPIKLETLHCVAGTEWNGATRVETKTTPTNTSSASSTSSRTANLENEIESCGNVFILNRRKLFLICGLCDSKYANMVQFAKHVNHCHKILAVSADDASNHGGCGMSWDAADSEYESSSTASGLIVKGGFLIRFVSDGARESNPTPPPTSITPSLDENLLKHVPIKIEDETDDDITMVDDTSSNFEDNIESCGNVYVMNRQKLFLICGFCEGKYAQLEQLAVHLHESHTIFQDDPDSENDVSPKDTTLKDVTIKQEPPEVPQPKKCKENAPPMVAIPNGTSVNGGNIPQEEMSVLPVVTIPAATKLKKALRDSKNTKSQVQSAPQETAPVKRPQKKTPKDKQPEPSAKKSTAKKTIKDYLCKKDTSPTTYACKECGKAFTKQSRLVEHIRLHTGEKPFKCDECGKTFRTKLRMTEHQLRHRSEKAFSCEICGLGLATRQDYTLHQRHHKGDKRYACKECGKAFVRSSDLKTHVRIHSDERPFKCEVCSLSFRANQNLIIHRRVHQGDKQFKCDYCDKRFLRKIDKRVHHRTHTGEKAFKCEICGRGYSAKVHVRRHIQKRHIDPIRALESSEDDSKGDGNNKKPKEATKAAKKSSSKSFKCDQCPKTYSAKVTLGKHIKQAHGKPTPEKPNSNGEQEEEDPRRLRRQPVEQTPLSDGQEPPQIITTTEETMSSNEGQATASSGNSSTPPSSPPSAVQPIESNTDCGIPNPDVIPN